MRDRLTLKSARPPEQAADRQDFNPQGHGQQPPQELQTAFLTDMLDRMATVYLVSGIKLSGTLVFDNLHWPYFDNFLGLT